VHVHLPSTLSTGLLVGFFVLCEKNDRVPTKVGVGAINFGRRPESKKLDRRLFAELICPRTYFRGTHLCSNLGPDIKNLQQIHFSDKAAPSTMATDTVTEPLSFTISLEPNAENDEPSKLPVVP
jgi:hypothetical protein